MNTTEETVSGLFRDINAEITALTRYKGMYDKYLSTGFNVFDACGAYLDEDRISNVIADLLNPCGNHGQGRKFLDYFIKRLCPVSPESCDVLDLCKEKQGPTKVFREYVTDNGRRIDIVIDFGDVAIGIENKPYAAEGENQLFDYDAFLEKKWGKNKYVLLFLSEQEPQSYNKEKDLLKMEYFGESYSLLSWLEECRLNCESQKVRFFLEDFMEQIKRNIKPAWVEKNDGCN